MILKLLRRTMDAAPINAIANHKDVRPYIGGDGRSPLDFTPIVSDPKNFALIGQHGGWVLQALGPGLYEGHSFFLPAGRGRFVRDAMAECVRFMFCATDCDEIVAKAPLNNKAVLGLCIMGGFREIFRRTASHGGGPAIETSFRSLRFDDWRSRDDLIPDLGAKFHAQLEFAKERANSPLDVHSHDEAHDRAVGASFLMFLNGNHRKAVWTYNRWARFAGYHPIALLSENPLVIDVSDAIVGLRNGDLEVLQCRVERLPPSVQ